MTEGALVGTLIRLEPLDYHHADGLAAASAADPTLYAWSPVPQGAAEVRDYIDAALAWRDAGSAVPYATVLVEGGVVIGSTRFWNLERWNWPGGRPRHGRENYDACEIDYTWLTRSAVRTGANTEAKWLMLSHAFETWQVLRKQWSRMGASSPSSSPTTSSSPVWRTPRATRRRDGPIRQARSSPGSSAPRKCSGTPTSTGRETGSRRSSAPLRRRAIGWW